MISLDSLYGLIVEWKNSSYLSRFEFPFNETLYSNALNIFKQDYYNWYNEELSKTTLCLYPQFCAILLYRIAREYFLNTSQNMGKVGIRPQDLYFLLSRSIGLCEIYYSASIGPRFCITHGSGTVIGARVEIGENVEIHQNCTLGDRHGGRPIIGNNVKIFANSLVLGNVTIGDNSIIGANSLVIDSFPANSILVGSPARNINKK